VVVLIDDEDRVVYEKRLPNSLEVILFELSRYKKKISGVVVESTFNWYWLVDGLQEDGYEVHLANTAAIKQYEGLKYTDDKSDARWLAHILRLGILPEGYIYPKEDRAVRDLLRKRSQLVNQRVAHILSIQNLMSRNTGKSMSGAKVKALTEVELSLMFENEDLAMAVMCNLRAVKFLTKEITMLEKTVQARVSLRPEYENLLSVDGIGKILALTIMLETGVISRFGKVGNFASYCRCVDSRKISNEKKKGANNGKNGNKYLAWAFVEAANFAIRFNPQIKRFYDKKKSKRNSILAIKAVAHKLARACYHMLTDNTQFQVEQAFA
jgi:transposase